MLLSSHLRQQYQSTGIKYRQLNQRLVTHWVIDAIGFEVYSESEWKVHQHGQEKQRGWCKRHLAVRVTDTIVTAEVSLDTVVLLRLLNLLRRKIKPISADGAYDTVASMVY